MTHFYTVMSDAILFIYRRGWHIKSVALWIVLLLSFYTGAAVRYRKVWVVVADGGRVVVLL